MAFAVLLGTLFPLVVEAVSGDRVTVGAPFFNQVTIPIWLLILALMGIGPLLPWRKAKHQTLKRNLAWMLGGALVSGSLGYVLGVQKFYPLLTVALAGWNLVSLGLLLGGALSARVRATGKSISTAFGHYAVENRRRFGSMIVHFGIVVIALGIAGSGGYRTDTQLRATLNEPVPFAGYELTLRQLFQEERPDRISQVALVELLRNGRVVGELRPRINRFRNRIDEQSVPSPGVRYTLLGDVYLVLNRIDEDGQSAVLRAVNSPLVSWIWLGTVILAVGTAYALLPQRRLQPQTQLREQEVPA
jgi:cytochrome c-type biogenesis protein CcmF